MNFTMRNIKVKSSWFDFNDNENGLYDNKFLNMGGYRGFYLYLSLFRFRVYNQEQDYMFITSISLLRKEMKGYTTKDIFKLLKLLQKQGVIKLNNLSRWDYLIDGKDKIKDKDILVIVATDVPETKTVEDEKYGTKEEPVDHDNFYINVSLELLQHYIDVGLNEKYFPLYCLISRLSNFSVEKKSWMSIDRMAKVIGINKNTVHRMIIQMNKKYLLYSAKKRKKDGNGKRGDNFEHHIARNMKGVEFIRKEYRDKINRYVKKMS